MLTANDLFLLSIALGSYVGVHAYVLRVLKVPAFRKALELPSRG